MRRGSRAHYIFSKSSRNNSMKPTVLLLLFMSTSLTAQLDLIETDELKLVTYDYGHRYIIPHATRCFHAALDFYKKLFDYEPSEKITVLIQDFGDYGNAGATAVPTNAISMGLSPFSYAFETNPAGERVFSMMNHELVHVVALDNSSNWDRFYQSLFMGKVESSSLHPLSILYSNLTSPRKYAPRWYHEGLASYLETWMGGGLGLALGSYDEMVFRSKVLEKDRIYSAQGLESEGVTSDFQGRSNSYLYGTRFMGYLAYTYGPEKMIEWAKRKNGSKRSFSGQFNKVYGLSINKAWDDWIQFEKDWQEENIQTISQYPITKGELISDQTFGSVSYPQFDKNRNVIYVAVNYPGQVPHLAALDLKTGQLDRLIDIKGAALFYVTSLTYDNVGDKLFYTTDNDAWRDLNEYDISKGKSKLLQKDFRSGDLTFNKVDRSLWAIKHLNGFSTIIKIEEIGDSGKEYNNWEQKWTLPYGSDIFDIDISPDGKIMSAAVSDLLGNQSLILYNLDSLDQKIVVPDTIFNFEDSSPQSFRFSENGKFLTGSSYYSGVSNIFKVDLDSRDIHVMSNALTGLFRPWIVDDDRIFAFRYSSKGFQPVWIDNNPVDDVAAIEYLGNKTIEKFPILKEWELNMPSKDYMDVDAATVYSGKYKAGSLMRLNYAYPTVIGYKDHVGLGYHFDFSDPFNFKTLTFDLAYTPSTWNNALSNSTDSTSLLGNDETLHFAFSTKLGSYSIDGGYNQASFYDLFGPTKYSRKGATLNVGYERSIIWDPPRNLDFNVNLGGYYGLDQSPEFQQISDEGFDDNFFVDLDASLLYRYRNNSLGAVDYEKGVNASLRPAVTYSSNKLFPRLVGTLDYGIQLPINHSSIWIRNAAGHSFSDVFNPFTRYGFASFGNNYVDYRSFRRYRAPFSFPGIGFDEEIQVIARSFIKNTIEFVLPPLRFRKVGSFNFFANWIQPTVFTSVLNISNGNEENGRYADAGFQLDARVVMFSLLPSTISFGYARAWNLDNSNSYGEWMISLKLLR